MKKRTPFVRIMAIFLAVLMLLGGVILILQLFPLQSYAMSAEEYEAKQIRVGFDYGTNGVVPAFTLSSSTGFVIGNTGSTGREFYPLYALDATTISAAIDDNLTVKNGEYASANSSSCIIGGYHLQLSNTYSSAQDVRAAIETLRATLQEKGLYNALIYPFPARIGQTYTIRIGDFGSASSASSRIAALQNATGAQLQVVAPDSTIVSYINKDKNVVLFEFSTNDGIYSAVQSASGGSMQRTSGRSYAGNIEFARSYGLLRVVNIVPIETYVEGVLPYEVSNTWPVESLKAFAICVRSYAFATGKHKGYGIDLCNDTCCQAYRGTGSVNAAVRTAVQQTKGIVMTYGNTICTAMYTAVSGGCTVDAFDLYGLSDVPYMKAVQTPWEEYEQHPKGLWTYTVSGHDLYLYLRDVKGCTEFTNDIVDIRINKLANNSTYVNSITIRDADGHEKTVNYTYRVYAMLARYTNCANFVIYHNGELQGGAFQGYGYPIRTAQGKQMLSPNADGSLQIRTANEVLTVDGSALFARSATDEIMLTPSENQIPQIGIDAMNAANTNEFVFIGKGWGHGCGLSQWGALNYAQRGADYVTILRAYFTDIQLEKYTDFINRIGG